MKKFIKKFIPQPILRWYGKRHPNVVKFRSMNTHEVFTDIYQNNHWRSSESISGKGSVIEQTETLIHDLEKLLKDFKITSVLDLPCGDFNWMQRVDLTGINYIGADIVQELITTNIDLFKERENLKFEVLNLIADPLPKSELILVRDCLVHLSFDDIAKAIQNMKASGSKYLLTTTFTNRKKNYDIVTGDWRPINLQKKPFNFTEPLLLINENCKESNGEYRDKSMALWELDKL